MTIIGVMPATFDPTTSGDQLWVPQAFTPERKANHDQHHNIVIGLLRAGVPPSRAQAELSAVQKELDERSPNANFNGTVGVRPFAEAIVGDYRERLFMTLGAVMFVLLIACGNVANLLLARGASFSRKVWCSGLWVGSPGLLSRTAASTGSSPLRPRASRDSARRASTSVRSSLH